jgi:hypothetical protein
MLDATHKIRALNDQLRSTFLGGNILLTCGVNALNPEMKRRLLERIRSFAEFTPENDPHGEHDFGCIEVDGQNFFFKIDCYDRQLEFASPNAADPTLTTRVMTVMLADEY